MARCHPQATEPAEQAQDDGFVILPRPNSNIPHPYDLSRENSTDKCMSYNNHTTYNIEGLEIISIQNV